MLRYNKGPAPKCLTTLRTTPGATWASVGGADRDEIREKLVYDQAALCAYCQRRICADKKMKIEHWNARAAGGRHFQWANLLGVCEGRFAGLDKDRPACGHCDSERGDIALFLHPVAGQGPSSREHIRYAGDGTVSSRDLRAQNDIATLNLNAAHLKRGRAEVLDALRGHLERRAWSKNTLEAELRSVELTPGGRAPEYAEFLRYYLERWLRRRSSL